MLDSSSRWQEMDPQESRFSESIQPREAPAGTGRPSSAHKPVGTKVLPWGNSQLCSGRFFFPLNIVLNPGGKGEFENLVNKKTPSMAFIFKITIRSNK